MLPSPMNAIVMRLPPSTGLCRVGELTESFAEEERWANYRNALTMRVVAGPRRPRPMRSCCGRSSYNFLRTLGRAERDGQVRHGGVAGRAVPVPFTGGDPDHVAGPDLVRVAAVAADEPTTGDDLEDLATLMAVPEGARAGGERHVGDGGAV